jgi:hypothetical protein
LSPSSFSGTSKPITPFAKLISLVEFIGKMRLTDAIHDFMPFQLNSPNALLPAHTLTAFFSSGIVGTSRFSHSEWLRADKALHVMLDIPRSPGTDTIRNFFSHFSQDAVEPFWCPLWRWLLPHFPAWDPFPKPTRAGLPRGAPNRTHLFS